MPDLYGFFNASVSLPLGHNHLDRVHGLPVIGRTFLLRGVVPPCVNGQQLVCRLRFSWVVTILLMFFVNLIASFLRA